MTDTNSLVPGWYPDPDHPQTQRWWNGRTWTPRGRPLVTELDPLGRPIAVVGDLPRPAAAGITYGARYRLRWGGAFLAAYAVSLLVGVAVVLFRQDPVADRTALASLVFDVCVVPALAAVVFGSFANLVIAYPRRR